MENFKILSKLGEGSFSKVYKVQRKIDNQIYALKKVQITNLSEKQKLNSLNEIRVLASVKSKYIVEYKESFLDEKDSTLCIVMEFADKGDLSSRIKEQKKRDRYFNEKDIWRIFIQLVKGLKALHDLNIIHRDIKSSNIFLFSDGTAKLGDLNVCKILTKEELGKTQAGTPFFAAPEVWREKPYGKKSDIWSLGCVLYEMVCLKCPFRSDNMVELYNKILVVDFNGIPKKFSNDLYCIIKNMIKYEPEKRISCEQILDYDLILKHSRISRNSNKTVINNESESEESVDHLKNEEKSKLLGTIYIPNNLMYLNSQLPKSNYSQEIKFIHKSIDSLNPIKTKSDLKPIFLSQNSNKNNSDGKLFKLNKIKRYPEYSKINNNLSIFFNEDKNKNKPNFNESERNMKGPIKLKKINSNLSSSNEINKNKEFSFEKLIHNKINNNKFPTVDKKEIEYKVNQLSKKTISDLINNVHLSEKDVKTHHIISNEKFKEIIRNKKQRKKSHGLKKDYKFKLKVISDNNINQTNTINDRYSDINQNEYKQIPTEVNVSENNKDELKKLSNDKNGKSKYLSTKNLREFNVKKDEFIKKNSNDNILPILKSSFKRNIGI